MADVTLDVSMPTELVHYIVDQVALGRFESVSACMTTAAAMLREVDLATSADLH